MVSVLQNRRTPIVALRRRGAFARLVTMRLPACLWVAALTLTPIALRAQINVVTNRYDQPRTGANLAETALNTGNVNPATFGKLYSYPVDGPVYAQPLFVSDLSIGGRLRNVLFVATMNDKVYAFDADSPSPTPLWLKDFTNPPFVTAVPLTAILPVSDGNIIGNIGVQGTPVIDVPTQTMYLVARTLESGVFTQRLHALDITTGLDRNSSPVTITATVPGNSADSQLIGSTRWVTFNPKMQSQRIALALSNGVVLIGWGTHEDVFPNHGWIMAYDAATLAQVPIRGQQAFAVVTDHYLGGVWQGGRAPAIDPAGNAYFATGNGLYDGKRNFADSLLKFRVSRTGLDFLDWFTPSNEMDLWNNDTDLSGSGFTIIPGTNKLFGGGKEGVLYLLDGNNLGRKQTGDPQVAQKIDVHGGHVMGGPVYWNSQRLGPIVYNWSETDYLRAYAFANGNVVVPDFVQGRVVSPDHPGGSLTVSANGSTTGTGIIWASIPTQVGAKFHLAAGALRAFDAETLVELWHSDMVSTDKIGNMMKFVPPVVANGKVFLPNHDNQVHVYGLLATRLADFAIRVLPASQQIAPNANGTYSVEITAQGGFAGQVTLTGRGGPSGTTFAFDPAAISGAGTSTMTVSIPAGAAANTYSLEVTGRSGSLVHPADASMEIAANKAPSGAIGIDFTGTNPGTMSPAERAGVIEQTNWNSAAGAARSTPLALVDGTGATTNATVTWSSNNGYATLITDTAGNARLMKGYLDTSSTSTTSVNVAGLAPGTYDVYVYVDGANSSFQRSGAYTIAGPGITTTTITATDTASIDFAGTFQRADNSAGNYVKFTVPASSFTLTATPGAAATDTRRAPINGIQMIPVASPRRPIAIDFVGTNATMAATETAGVVVQSNWNAAFGAARTVPLALVDSAGAATPAAVTWTSNNVYATPITDAAGNARMMKGYLDTSSTTTTTVTLSGLSTGTYDVYVYVDGANNTTQRTGSYTLTAAGGAASTIKAIDAASTDFSGIFSQANGSVGNYLKFTMTGGGFTLTAVPDAASTTTRRAPVSGIQIVPR